MSNLTYEKLRKHITGNLNPRIKEFRKIVSDINNHFKNLELGISVWYPEKIYQANLGGIDAESYIGYSRLEGKWGLIIKTVERDQKSGTIVGHRLVPIESSRNMEVIVNALRKVPQLMRLIQEAVDRQTAALENLDDEFSKFRDSECEF